MDINTISCIPNALPVYRLDFQNSNFTTYSFYNMFMDEICYSGGLFGTHTHIHRESLLYAIGKFCIGQWGHFCTFGSSRFRFSSFENPLIFFQLWGMDQPFHEIVALSEKIKAINYSGKNTGLETRERERESEREREREREQ